MEVLGVEAAVFYVPYWKEGETDVPMVIIPKEKLKRRVYILIPILQLLIAKI